MMTDLRYGCVHYYPTEFKVDSYHKMFLHECSPIIPEIDIEKISKVKDSIDSEDNEEIETNFSN